MHPDRLHAVFADVRIVCNDSTHASPCFESLLEELRKLCNVLCAENDVHPRKAFVDLFYHSRLLRHASAYRQHEIRIVLSDFLKLSERTEEPLVCVFTYTAGIDHSDIRFIRIVNMLVAHGFEKTCDVLRVMLVHLASICDYMIFAHWISSFLSLDISILTAFSGSSSPFRTALVAMLTGISTPSFAARSYTASAV